MIPILKSVAGAGRALALEVAGCLTLSPTGEAWSFSASLPRLRNGINHAGVLGWWEDCRGNAVYNTNCCVCMWQVLQKGQSPRSAHEFCSPLFGIMPAPYLGGRGWVLWAGPLGPVRSVLSTLAQQLRKGASRERGRGKQPAWGAFSQAFAGRLLKVIPTSNKKGFQTQRKAQPG